MAGVSPLYAWDLLGAATAVSPDTAHQHAMRWLAWEVQHQHQHHRHLMPALLFNSPRTQLPSCEAFEEQQLVLVLVLVLCGSPLALVHAHGMAPSLLLSTILCDILHVHVHSPLLSLPPCLSLMSSVICERAKARAGGGGRTGRSGSATGTRTASSLYPSSLLLHSSHGHLIVSLITSRRAARPCIHDRARRRAVRPSPSSSPSAMLTAD